MCDTVSNKSLLGDRLNKIQRTEKMELLFKGKKIPVVSIVSIGRDKSNMIVIDSQLVSRQHAEIHKIDDQYFIKDLNSTNGTMVNNQTIPQNKYYRINKDDIITIGKAEISLISFF
jgi:pSer/pThr/pTyr-binding forkhead associated (FHA) protein